MLLDVLTHKFITLCTASIMAGISCFGAAAQVVENGADSVVHVQLLEGWRGDDGAHFAAIKIDLAPGWKTYWRAPGDGGVPTHVSWTGSKNLADAKLIWPRPVVFRNFGMRSVGYKDSVVLPMRLTAKADGPIGLNTQLNIGVCNEICLPVRLSMSTVLSGTETENVKAIKTAMSSQPKTVSVQMNCTLGDSADGDYNVDIMATLPELAGLGEAAIVELADPAIWVSEPQVARTGSHLRASVRLIMQKGAKPVDLSGLRLTMLTTQDAIELNGCN